MLLNQRNSIGEKHGFVCYSTTETQNKLCVCVCVCVCVISLFSLSLLLSLSLSVCVCMCVVCACMYVCLCVCLCVYVCTDIHVNKPTCLHVFVFAFRITSDELDFTRRIILSVYLMIYFFLSSPKSLT